MCVGTSQWSLTSAPATVRIIRISYLVEVLEGYLVNSSYPAGRRESPLDTRARVHARERMQCGAVRACGTPASGGLVRGCASLPCSTEAHDSVAYTGTGPHGRSWGRTRCGSASIHVARRRRLSSPSGSGRCPHQSRLRGWGEPRAHRPPSALAPTKAEGYAGVAGAYAQQGRMRKGTNAFQRVECGFVFAGVRLTSTSSMMKEPLPKAACSHSEGAS
jgi:hypothetical protein